MGIRRKYRRILLIVLVLLSISINIAYGKSQTNEEVLKGYVSKGYDGKELNQRNSLLRFQAENNLIVDGILGENTNRALEGINKKIVDIVPKEVTETEWFIVVNKSNRILTVYNKGEVYKKYPVALGKEATATPDYKFTIINKLIDPYWGGMGGKFKPVKGGAPNNPLGKRWLGLSTDKYTGYGIHGNSAPFSIGQNISAGCIRMINDDVDQLFNYIPIKTKVWVGDEELLKDWGIEQYIEYEKVEPKEDIDLEIRQEIMLSEILQQTEDIKNQENIERITYELIEDLSKENIEYVEIRFAPFLHMEEGLTFDQLVDSVLEGMYRARKDFNILSDVILISMAYEPVENSIKLVEYGEKYLEKGVLAIEPVENEEKLPPKIHGKEYKLLIDELDFSIEEILKLIYNLH